VVGRKACEIETVCTRKRHDTPHAFRFEMGGREQEGESGDLKLGKQREHMAGYGQILK